MHDETFYQRLLDLEIPMTLRLVLTRNVEGKSVAGSFDEALRPRVLRAGGKEADGEAALERFRRYFYSDEVAKGTEIIFSFMKQVTTNPLFPTMNKQ